MNSMLSQIVQERHISYTSAKSKRMYGWIMGESTSADPFTNMD